jgi:hypothetical protein
MIKDIEFNELFHYKIKPSREYGEEAVDTADDLAKFK